MRGIHWACGNAPVKSFGSQSVRITAMRRIKPMTKKEKIAAVVTAVWGVLVFIIASDASSGDAQFLFLILWVLPVLIWWGIHWIKKSHN